MRRAFFVAGLVMAGLLLPGQSELQTGPSLVPVQAIFTVEARHDHDKIPPVLNREDVMVYERHERLPVTDLTACTGDNAALELFLLLDDNSSTIIGSQFGDLRGFIEAQPVSTAIGIGYMHHGTVDTVQEFTTDHGRAASRLRVPVQFGAASPYLSLSDLIKRWPASIVRREVVLVTSGVDSLGGLGPTNPYLETAIEDAQRNGIIVYAIYMPAEGHEGHSFYLMNWAQNYLAQLAEETGGESYMLGFGPPVTLAPYFDEITARLQHQYRVDFLIRPESKGSLRQVRFSTEVPNAELVAAAKLYVPGSREERGK
jgi:hypothetical protein